MHNKCARLHIRTQYFLFFVHISNVMDNDCARLNIVAQNKRIIVHIFNYQIIF